MSKTAGEPLKKVVVVVNSAGAIIATAGATEVRSSETEPRKNEPKTGLKALPGQSVHVVDMPDSFFHCKSAVEKHKWLSRFRVVLDPEPRLMERYHVDPVDQ